MRQSQLFTKLLKEAPKDELSINAQLLIRAGFVDKLMAGVYSYLPLGFKVFKKIENIIREEIQKIGGQEIFLSALQRKESWKRTERWDTQEMFRVIEKPLNKEPIQQDEEYGIGKYGLGWTHEEAITPLVKKFVQSYRDLPVHVYQIQSKFRNEARAKSGLLRGVEFIMKDLYSFHADQDDLDAYYEKVKTAYFKIFERCGLGRDTFLTLASGGTFSQYSHEFQTITPAGEDEIYLCPRCNLGINKEIVQQEKNKCPECGNKELESRKSIEVGNIFKLGKKYTAPFNFEFRDKSGENKPVLMGCYGIGLGRLMGTIIEVHNDTMGMIWPEEVAPFKVHLIKIGESSEVKQTADKTYQDLQKKGIEVLYDDREGKTAGEKFAEADLIGIPLRMVVSEKTLKTDSVELKKRSEGSVELVRFSKIKDYVK